MEYQLVAGIYRGKRKGGREKEGENRDKGKVKSMGCLREDGSHTLAWVFSGHTWWGHSDFRRWPTSKGNETGKEVLNCIDEKPIGSARWRKECE